MPTHREKPLDVAHAKPGDAEQRRAFGDVDIDGKPIAMRKRPAELRIDVEVELATLEWGRDLVGVEAVVLEQPIRLVQPVFTNERFCPDGG